MSDPYKTAVITGAHHGLGRAINLKLLELGINCILWPDNLDLFNDINITKFAESIEGARVDLLVNCAGTNHLDWIENLSKDDWDIAMGVNARAPFLLTQALLPNLAHANCRIGEVYAGGTVLNISSVAARNPMTCSLVYNASKAALEMVTRQMARELWKSHQLTVFGIAPSKLSGTGMSKYVDERVPPLRGWTREEAQEYERKNLGTGHEIPVETLAEYVAWLLARKHRHFYLNGCIMPYGL
jgi:NAD(P)-dependent dehydrogenase (short-subunit alcohol dehydrogenase family)